jgi:hypothetical protein
MPACKNCGGNKSKVVYNYTPKIHTICPSPAGCLDDNKCSEILDAACVQYTGNNIIKCSTEDVVIQYDSAEEAFVKIIDLLCEKLPQPISSLFADIVEETDENGNPFLSAIAVNGTGPYTYEWKLKNDKLAPHYIEGSNTQVSLRLNCLGENGFNVNFPEDTEDPLYNIKVSNVYLKITDATNATAFTHYDYIHNCYLPVVNDPIEQEYIGSEKMAFWDFGPHPVTATFVFMDDITELTTCEYIKNYLCDSERDAYTRSLRDTLQKDQNENAINYLSGGRGLFPPYFLPLDYSILERDGLYSQQWMGLQQFPKIITVPKGCPTCTRTYLWNVIIPDYGESLAERYPIEEYPCTAFNQIPRLFPTLAEYPPGQWGDLLILDIPNQLFYAWDPIDNIWSSVLYNAIDPIYTKMTSTRDAHLKAVNEVSIAQNAFLLGNDYAPLHLYKYAQMKPYYIN